MRRDGGKPKTTIIRRKLIKVPHKIGFSVAGDIGVAGELESIAVVERPERLQGKIRGHAQLRLVLRNVVELLRRKKVKGLVVPRALLSRCRIRRDGWSGVKTRYRLSDPYDLERLNESPRLRASRLEGRHADRVRSGRKPRTQAFDRRQESRRSDKSHFDQISPAKSSCDEFPAILGSIQHFLVLRPRNSFPENVEVHSVFSFEERIGQVTVLSPTDRLLTFNLIEKLSQSHMYGVGS